MNKESFNKLTIDEQIEYFNEKLKEANSLTNICKNISIGRSTISDRFKKHNYKFNKISNQYELIENNANITNVIKGVTMEVIRLLLLLIILVMIQF